MKTNILAILLSFSLFCLMAAEPAAAFVIRKGEKAYIEDQDGERWDVTQAKSLGFKPERFQYGIGRNAFTPLDDSSLSDDSSAVLRNPRVIGITDGTEARAYAIPKLRYHEIANTRIGTKAVAVGY
ncbi:MAG: hypothetical protein V3S16_06740 [Candidatus Desulfatibia sp.]|jgi:hypothetical protein|uniref:hypothetical protein n=1 Tax=Candidatus Desulfatibia sp. TaxID=3101189 RepID=UPI002F306D8A